MRLILCLRSYLLLVTWFDSDEFWTVYRVDHVLLHGAIFDFRFWYWKWWVSPQRHISSIRKKFPREKSIHISNGRREWSVYTLKTSFELVNAFKRKSGIRKSIWTHKINGILVRNWYILFLPFRDRMFLVSKVSTQILTIDLQKFQIHFQVFEWGKYHAF